MDSKQIADRKRWTADLGKDYKAVRDLEREQWKRMSDYLTPWKLREYKMEHALAANELRKQIDGWFNPSKAEQQLRQADTDTAE